jgi:hypothetical protein
VLGTIPTCRPDRADRRRLRPVDRRGHRGEMARDRRAGAVSPVAAPAMSGTGGRRRRHPRRGGRRPG